MKFVMNLFLKLAKKIKYSNFQLKNVFFSTLSIIVKNFKADDWTLTANGDRKQEASIINLSIVIPYMFKKCFLPLQLYIQMMRSRVPKKSLPNLCSSHRWACITCSRMM